jgi:hypothetical protein
MEIKLYVMTHKENIGSTIYATSNMSEHEIEIIEASTSRRTKSSEYELREKSNSGYWVYFFSYKGGKDEFGREYQEIIASAFTYRLTVTEGEKLRKIFYRIRNEISNKSFSIEKSKFVGIKRRDDVDRFKQNRINQWKKHLKFLILIIFMITSSVFIYDYSKKNPEKFIIISQIKNYGVIKSKINLQKREIYKYRENINIIENEIFYLEKYLYESRKELQPEFYERLKDKNKILIETSEGIKNELSSLEMAENMTTEEMQENRRYIEIEKAVQDYNSEIKSEKLRKIKEMSEQYLKTHSSFKSIKVKYYLNKIDKILIGEKSVNLNVDVFSNNSKLVWKKVEIQFSSKNKTLKREIEQIENKRISKMKLEMKYEDSVYVNIFLIEEDDKKLVASFGIKVDEMNRVEKIRVGEAEFYLKFNADYSDYIL